MGKKIGLLWLLCLLPVSLYAECVGTPSKKFPPLPDSYQTVIEINADKEHYSILQREYRDGKGKRMAITQLQQNKRTRVIVDGTNQQEFHIKDSDGTCTVINASDVNPGNDPFGAINKANGKFIFSTTEAMMKMEEAAVVVDNTEIRGIQVQHWCSKLSETLESHMYFTVPTWKTAGGASQKPVRFILQENTNSSSVEKFNCEYYTFLPRIKVDPVSVFEPPSGVICKGRKGSKKIPKLPAYFSYRQETVYDEYVKISDVWYDEKNRFLRIDYRPGGIERSMSAALSEIHDYNTGVLYTKNMYIGNCSASTISNSSFGTEQNATSWKKDKSYEVMLKNPLQYFYLDSNYVYVGKKMTRQVPCDVFASTRKSFVMPNGKSYPVVLEFYFASDEYTVLPDKANNISVQVPMMLLVSSQDKSLDLNMRINIVDFNAEQHDFSIFDVSSCYSNAARIHISILMDGQYVEATKEEIIGEGQMVIASLMKISTNRVQNVHMSHDTGSITLYASILDRSPASAQFTPVSRKKQTVVGDATIKGVKTMADCADNCVQGTSFVCNSFDYCGNNCILNRYHDSTKATDGGSVICTHYSRTVDGPQIKEIDLRSAWFNLRSGIAQGLFLLDIPNDTGDSAYKAIYARLDAGTIITLADIPKLKNTMKYKEEIVSPSSKDIQPVSVYYDASKNLTRFDSWSNTGGGPVETIQDFHLGVQYIINKQTGECHSGHISQGTFDVINEDPTKKQLTKMKDAWGLFYLDATYYFVGQKEIRGIMTDIFEAWRTDFSASNDALFRYHFLSQNWNSISALIPMKLEIVADMDDYNAVYNFFEFIEEPVAMTTFDVTECFRESNDIIDFQITFKGSYKLQPSNFILAVINKIKNTLKISGIRIQEPEISYNEYNTYFQASLLEPPPSISMFNLISGMSTVSKPEQIVKNVLSQEACADQCVTAKTINCNAFQYCQYSKRCELHTEHFGKSHTQESKTCSFYTRTEDAPLDLLSAKEIMIDLIDLSRKGMLNISFTVGKMTYRFPAKSILTNIDRDNSREIASVQNMESYTKTFEGGFTKKYSSIAMKISVDECAYRCTQSQMINCETFAYCYLQGMCLLSEDHVNKSTVVSTTWCDIYERNYLNLFEQLPGQTFLMQGESQIADVTDPDACARHCFNSGVGDCQSFEYCKSLGSCTFSKRHTMDVPSSDLTSSDKCSVYSLTFLKDFKKASTKVENLVDNVLIKNVSVKQCARICLKDEGPNCASFDYCPSGSICRITGVDEVGTGKVSGPTNLNCSHYTRTDRKILPKPFKIKYIKGNKGVATGLGIGMFLIGGLLGIMMIYIINKRGKNRTDDHTRVSFLRLEGQ